MTSAQRMLDRGATKTATVVLGRRVTVCGLRLLVTRGPDAPRSQLLTSDVVVIGTDPSCACALSDPTISRFHCELAVVEGRVRVRDLKSRNGTVVQKVAVDVGHLQDGAILQLGDTDIRIELADATTPLTMSEEPRFGRLTGTSVAMRRVFEKLERAAAVDATVILTGETGTGKDAAAESIHEASRRCEEPFIVVDCSAIPADLLESELFGHEKGAFTGAASQRPGLFEAAGGGTIFLDEIGELPLALQPKLLRVLENRAFRRVGGTTSVTTSARVLAATNRDLRVEVNEKRFRPDLYYRLSVLDVRLPPLREHLEDMPAIISRLLEGRDDVDERLRAEITSEAHLEVLRGHAWPGNVRELRNHLDRYIALQAPPSLDTSNDDAPGAGASALPDIAKPLKESREAWTRYLERAYVEAVSTQYPTVSAAARAAGVDRMYWYRLLHRYQLMARSSESSGSRNDL